MVLAQVISERYRKANNYAEEILEMLRNQNSAHRKIMYTYVLFSPNS